MKKIFVIVLLFIIIFVSGCSKDTEPGIYIGDDGYLYINNENTGTYCIGKDGVDGQNGKSAYEIALENGYEGSLEDWLAMLTNEDGSLKIYDKSSLDDLNGRLEVINNKIFLVTEYIETVTIREGIETAIAYENLAYYEIFEENNIAPLFMDSKTSEVDTFNDYSGTTTIQNEVYNTEEYAMYVEGTTSQQAMSSKTYSGTYYIASKIMCTRYEQGYLGIVFGSDSTKYENTTLQNTTDHFVTCSDIQTISNCNFFIGSCISANLDGYIDDPVIVNMSIFENAPSKEKLDSLYEEYLKMIKGETTPVIKYEEVLKERYYLLGEEHQEFSDKLAKKTFMEYMNKKAVEIGMENTQFIDAAGFYNSTTAYDLLRLGVYACAYDELVSAWHKDKYTISVTGNKMRYVELSTTVKGASLENYYFLFGGKTGTVDGQKNLLAIVEGPDERLFVVVVLGCGSDRFASAKQAMDAAVAKYNDPSLDVNSYSVDAKSAAVCLLPKNNTFAYTDYELNILFEKDIYTQRTPASVTKVMTAICMLDYVADINENFMIKASDITSGSGNYFFAGDIISYREALHAMMLPSSNTTAEAVATAVGHKILEYDSKK